MRTAAEQQDIQLPTGRLRAHLWGFETPEAPTAVCIPGLSSNATGFDRLAAELFANGRQVVALDLRGRAASEHTPAGTYGWPAHAASLAAVLEDVEWGKTHPQDALWSRLSCPTLLLTAAIPLGDGKGFVVAPTDKARFLEAVRDASVVSVDANHFGILTAPATSGEIRAFLGPRPA